MDTSDFVSRVKRVRLDSISPAPNNPRGTIERNESFERLVASIQKVGILVPLVVRELPSGAETEYELVDGERRYLAAKELRLPMVPAHVVHKGKVSSDFRKLMFHLHMTRDQWEPIAQCRSLVDAYPELDTGLQFDEKSEWVARLADELGYPKVTARDRIHVLAWPKSLKEEFFRYDESHPNRDVYSYVLAIEASVVEPSRSAFPNFYNHGHPVETTANKVRESLLKKMLSGLETGTVTNREQIREVSPLFTKTLEPAKKKIAVSVFRDLVERKDFQFEDAKAEITTRLPELLEERPAKPQRIIASITSLTRTLEGYDPKYLEQAGAKAQTRKKLADDFREALEELADAAEKLRKRL